MEAREREVSVSLPEGSRHCSAARKKCSFGECDQLSLDPRKFELCPKADIECTVALDCYMGRVHGARFGLM